MYDDLSASSNVDIKAVRATGHEDAISEGPFDHWFGRVSPDGRWIAYTSNELGQYEVFVQRFPKASGYFKVSSGGGFQPIWNRHGGELFYLAPDGKLMVAQVATDSGFKPLPPHVLFQTHVNVATVNPPESLNHYDVSRDGNRFLISSRGTSRAVPIVLVFDWRAVLTRR